MLREPIQGMTTETKVYDLEEDTVLMPKANSSAMVIERGADYETEEFIKSIESDLLQKDFTEKRKVFLTLSRRANEVRAQKSLKKFLFYSLVSEVQRSESRLETTFYIMLIKDSLRKIKLEGEFKITFTQSLVLLFEIEKVNEVAIMLLELISDLCRDSYFENDVKYEIIALMHSRLYHPDFKIKKNALSIIVSLTRGLESDFLVVFESMFDRCVESQSRDLILVFLQTMADLDFPLCSPKIHKLVTDIIMSPIFSYNKESLTYLLKFVERIVLFSSPSSDLARNVFIFLCKNIRNLHKEIRKKSIDVLCKMDLRQVGEELLQASIQKEKFEDYQAKKKNLLTQQMPLSNQNLQLKKLKTVENNTEKIVNQLEMKSSSENSVTGCIHHALEDELPEVRISAIKALETLGKILTVEKGEEIKELLLYFLNDDFDRVRIKSLQSLSNLFVDISFSDFELDTIQFNLKENIYELRIAIYKLLCNFNPKKSIQMIKIIQRLTENIKLYREDAPWIYKTIKKIFEKNKKFQLDVLNELLFSDSANLIQEKDFKDPESIVRVILLSNALKFNQGLIERYPHYFKKHVILLKESYPSLIFDMENDDNNAVLSMKNSIVGEETIKSFLKCLNEQVRGKENYRLTKTLKYNFENGNMEDFGSKTLEMFWFCDKLIRRVRKMKLEMNSILPDVDKIVDTLFQIYLKRQSLRISPNLKKYFNLCEAFFWVEYLYCKVKIGHIRRQINVTKINNLVNSLYDSSSALSRDDSTGQFGKLCQALQPLLNNISHNVLLTNTNLLSIFAMYINEFQIQEFAFFADDFTQILTEKAFIHPKESEGEVIEVVPRYPFNFKLYVETESQVDSTHSDCPEVLHCHQRIR